MAQRVYWNWKDPDLTADLNKWLRGFLPSGVYRGFDKNVDITSGWNFKLSPLSTAVTIVDNALDEVPTSVLVTRQGSIVTETGDIVLAITPANATLPRIDLIICTHVYDEIVGGTSAVYSVVEGTPSGSPAGPTVPDIPNPTTDVLIGTLYVSAGRTNVSTCSYIKASVPEFANKPASIPLTQRNTANGVATLGSDSYVNSLLPALATDAWLQNKITTNEKVAIENIIGYPLEQDFSGVPIILILQGGVISVIGPTISITAGLVHYNGKNYPIQASSVTGDINTAYLEFVPATNTVLDKTFSYSNGYFIVKDDAVPSFTVTASHRLATLKYLNRADYQNTISSGSIFSSIAATNTSSLSAQIRAVKKGNTTVLQGSIIFTSNSTSPPIISLTLQDIYKYVSRVNGCFSVNNITANLVGAGSITGTNSTTITLNVVNPTTSGHQYLISFSVTYDNLTIG